jgi:tRNA modification GTPase
MPADFSGVSPRDPAELDAAIVALASARGVGVRSVLRLSGKGVWQIVAGCLHPGDAANLPRERVRLPRQILLPGLHSPLPVDLLLWPAPRSYTGQDLIEVHTLASMPIIDLLLARFQSLGARLARPGEFTLRAFLAGKLDLTQAEAVRAVIDATHPEEMLEALNQLAGGVSHPLKKLREELLRLLAEVEAGLDFAEEDLAFIGRDELAASLATQSRIVRELLDQVEKRSLPGRPFRVVLAGPPNAGKSSLFNALLEQSTALVSPTPGTTRDYLVQRWNVDKIPIELIDTAGAVGFCESSVEAQAQAARQAQLDAADLTILCSPLKESDEVKARGLALHVLTKVDLQLPVAECGDDQTWIATSAVTGQGLATLRDRIIGEARQAWKPAALALGAVRARVHLDECQAHLAEASQLVNAAESPELLALELRLALEAIGELVGDVCTEDLLDRVFSQFCIGK